MCCRLKSLETEQYSQEEAERAAGMGSYIEPRKRKVTTITSKFDDEQNMDESDDVPVKKIKKSKNEKQTSGGGAGQARRKIKKGKKP